MGNGRKLMVIAAHPDDETLGFGGVLARYASEGTETFLVTATRGQGGRYNGHPPGSTEHPGRDELAQIRERELHAAGRALGISRVTLLDYEDQHLDAANVTGAVAALVREIRHARPDVVLTFPPDGAYGHPDHIAISQFASAAVIAAARAGFGDGEPHAVSKLYYLAWNARTWAAYQSAFKKLVCMVDGVERQATPWPDWAITTVIDTHASSAAVWEAVACHASQVAAYAALKTLAPADRDALWGSMSFYRAFSLVNSGRRVETDLFEGIGDRRVEVGGRSEDGDRGEEAGGLGVEGGQRRDAPLAMSADEFRDAGHALVDRIADRLAAVPRHPVTRDDSPAGVRSALGLGGPLPEEGAEAGALLTAADALFDHSLFNAHPRFFGYITAPPAPIGIFGDFLASALNPNVGSWVLSPAATEIEAETVRWIGQFIGFPARDGLLVSGGNMANIVCLIAARAAAAPDARTTGIGAGQPLVAYASAETHTWIQKAADICGLGTSAIRWIATDVNQRMDVAALRGSIDDDLAAGRRPFLVVGTAGSVSTGAIDPLGEIAAVCRDKDVWFHVDGAYGGFAAALPDSPADLRALAQADSVAVDPHKWLYAPLEAGCALLRDPHALRAAFAYKPAYYHFDEAATNYVERGPQNSRGFRALKVWLALKHAGASGYRRMITDDIALSRSMAAAVERHPELQLLTQSLSITTFRYVPADLRARLGDPETEKHLDALNASLLDTLQRGGDVFVSNAVIGGRYALRACIVNFHTTVSDVEAVPDIVVRAGRAITEIVGDPQC
jgi:glutamate/tyrosine decarboxylase-like PLP-dependent enzyme/LmbE family N-acetylglucosaminyl deacetylase